MEEKYQPYTVIDPFSLLVINRSGTLRRIFCPFWVRCKASTILFELSNLYVVDMVKSDMAENVVTYIINGQTVEHSNFEIILI
jgi:hypothetical protein